MNALPYNLFKCPECGFMQKMTLHPSSPWTLEDISPEEAQQEVQDRQLEYVQQEQKWREEQKKQWQVKGKQEQQQAERLKERRERRRNARCWRNRLITFILVILASLLAFFVFL